MQHTTSYIAKRHAAGRVAARGAIGSDLLRWVLIGSIVNAS